MKHKIKPIQVARPQIFIASLLFSLFSLSACSPKPEPAQVDPAAKPTASTTLPALNAESQAAQFTVPPCKAKHCAEIQIESLKTQDPWINQWITQHIANVVLQQVGPQVGQGQTLSLQQAVDAYAKKSAQWQQEFNQNQAYQLKLSTRIAIEHQQYILLNISVDSLQGDIVVEQRQYFAVADRKQQKNLTLGDVLQPNKQAQLNQYIQVDYQQWLKEQSPAVQLRAPKQLLWQQADWFFDEQGVGLHFRANQISPDGAALSIYLSRKQTQAVLQTQILQQMFV